MGRPFVVNSAHSSSAADSDRAVDAAGREIDRALAAGASVAVLSLTNLVDDHEIVGGHNF